MNTCFGGIIRKILTIFLLIGSNISINAQEPVSFDISGQWYLMEQFYFKSAITNKYVHQYFPRMKYNFIENNLVELNSITLDNNHKFAINAKKKTIGEYFVEDIMDEKLLTILDVPYVVFRLNDEKLMIIEMETYNNFVEGLTTPLFLFRNPVYEDNFEIF